MTFKHVWNLEVICQFWATVYIDVEHKIFHSMTEGLHCHCDYHQFSCLLRFDHHDHDAPSLYGHYPNGVGSADFIEAALYVDLTKANGTTEGLKPISI